MAEWNSWKRYQKVDFWEQGSKGRQIETSITN